MLTFKDLDFTNRDSLGVNEGWVKTKVNLAPKLDMTVIALEEDHKSKTYFNGYEYALHHDGELLQETVTCGLTDHDITAAMKLVQTCTQLITKDIDKMIKNALHYGLATIETMPTYPLSPHQAQNDKERPALYQAQKKIGIIHGNCLND